MQSETEDRWYVEVGGAPKMMTLDELVESFEAGTINSKTLVCEVGGSEWKPLSEVADLGDEEEAPLSQHAPAIAAAPVSASLPPAPVSQRPVPVGGSSAFPAARSTTATLSAWPPAVNASRPPAAMSSYVPPAGTSSPSVIPPSTMPVVQDLSIGDDDFKPRKSKAPYIMMAAVVLLVGGALGATRFSGGEVARPVPVPAAAPAPVETVAAAAPTTPPAPAAAPTPAPSAEEKTASADKPSDTRLSDDVKSKLKDADKSRADKKKAAKSTARSRSAGRTKSSGGSGVFRAGGNANDPLNSSL